MSLVGEEAVVPDLSDCLREGVGADQRSTEGLNVSALGPLAPPRGSRSSCSDLCVSKSLRSCIHQSRRASSKASKGRDQA